MLFYRSLCNLTTMNKIQVINCLNTEQWRVDMQIYEIKITKNTKKNIKIPNIFIINQRLEVTD